MSETSPVPEPEPPPSASGAGNLAARRELLRRNLLRANTAVGVVLATVLILAGAAWWQGFRATQMQSVALREQQRAEQAETASRRELWRSLLAEARATRAGESLERRQGSLNAVRRAAAIAPTSELRQEAVAGLALPEFQLEMSLPLDADARVYEFDPALIHCALGLTNGDVIVRRLSDGLETRRLSLSQGPIPPEQGRPLLLEFSPDGSLLSVRYSRGAFAVWEVVTGRVRFVRDADKLRRPASRALFSSDGRFVVAPVFTPDGFEVMDSETGRTVAHFPQISSFHHAAVRPGATQFAAYSDGKVSVFDWASLKVRDEFPCPTGARRLAWSQDGRQLAVVGNSLEAEVWDLESRQMRRLSGHRDSLFDVMFDPSGERLATCSFDGTTRLWDLRNGRLLGVTTDRRMVRWGTEERTGWTVSKEQLEVRRYVESPAYRSKLGTPGQADGTAFDVSPDGAWAVTRANGGDLLVWNLTHPGGPEVVLSGGVDSLSFHPHEAKLFLTRSGRLEERDFRVITNSDRISFRLGEPRPLPGVPDRKLYQVISSAEGRTRAYAHPLTGAIWVEHSERQSAIVTLEKVMHSSMESRSGSVWGTGSITLSPDGKWLVCGADGSLGTYAFDTATGQPVVALDDGSGGVQFSPDGRWLLLANGEGCRLFRTADWKRVWTVPSDPRTPSYSGVAAFSPRGDLVAYAGSSQSAQLLETATGRVLAVLQSPSGSPLNGLRWTADGRRLVGATRENTLDIWKPEVLRQELTALGLDWDLPDLPISALALPTPLAPPGFPRWIAGIIPLTIVVVAAILLLSLSRHRQLIEEFSQAEDRASRRERELAVEREVNELKGRFVSMVSHEFRTPLGITMSAVELLRNYLNRLPPAKLAELLEDIYQSTLRMSGLMEQVLLLGRVESGRAGFRSLPLDLPELVARIGDETQSATNRRCEIRVRAEAADLAGASGDESLLRHILSNLVSNAVKYSPAGGQVEVVVRRARDEAVFTVADQGLGIPQADQARLFEAFHRATNVGQTPGTGLGLLIVKRCVELHRGRIDFVSEEGRGSTFTVRLPLFENRVPTGDSGD